MKEIVRITSLVKETDLLMQINQNGTWMVLTEDFRIIPKQIHETDPAYKAIPIMKIGFTQQRTFWEMQYDTDDKPLNLKSEREKDATESEMALYQSIKQENELNRRKRLALKDFLSKHNQIQHGSDFNNGHVPKSTPIAKIEVMTQKARQNHLADRMKVQVFTLIDSMSWQDQYDVALYYAPYLAGKRRSEVVSGLVGMKGIGTKESGNGGIMWQRGSSGKGTNAEDFMLNYQGNPTVSMKIYVEKAVMAGIITKGNGGFYINGTQFVGRNVTDMVIYFSKDMQTYTNLIQHEVNKRGIGLPEDDLGDEKDEATLKTRYEKTMLSNMSTTEYQADYARLSSEVLRLTGRDVPDSKKRYVDLKEYVAQLQENENVAKQLQQMPTASLERAVDPATTYDLPQLKQVAKELGIIGYQSYQSVKSLKAKIDEFKKSQVVIPEIPVMGE